MLKEKINSITDITNTTFDITKPDETINLSKVIAQFATPGTPILLYGTLGTGKTFFTTHLIRTILKNPNEQIPSPTFSVLQQYQSDKTLISHYDLYRIKDAEELFELNIDEALQSHITIIEWPEIIEDYIKENFPYIAIKLSLNNNIRSATIQTNCL